ncbi:MAG: hypothetical protein ABI600_09300 [Luteolibacter sp.]
MNRLIVLMLSSFVLYGGPALAGDKVILRFLTEGAPADLGKVVCVAAGKEGAAFNLHDDQLSEAFTFDGRLIGLQTQQEKRRLSKIELPVTGKQFVVLLVAEAAGTLKPLVIDADPSSLRGGDVYFYNHTDRKIYGHLGATGFELAPGKGTPLRPSGDFSDGSYSVEFNVHEDTGERLLRTMRWPVQTRSRAYGFFFRNPAKNRIEFRAVDEYVELGKIDLAKP